jgi:hypothetical protein
MRLILLFVIFCITIRVVYLILLFMIRLGMSGYFGTDPLWA